MYKVELAFLALLGESLVKHIKKKQKISIILTIIIGLLCASLTVFALNDDVTVPTISQIKVETQTVNSGESFSVYVYATDDSGIRARTSVSEVVLTRKKENPAEDSRTKSVMLKETNEPGKYVADFAVNDSWVSGEYQVTYVGVMDQAGNIAYVSQYKDQALLPQSIITVQTDNKDAMPPTIEKIEVDSQIVSPGDTFPVYVYATDESGIQATTTVSEVVLTRKKDDSSQETKTRSVWIEETDEPGKYVANFKVNDNWAAGEYNVTYVGVMDKKGNLAYVSQFNNKKILPSETVTVQSSTADVTPPVITKIELSNKTVSPGDTFPVYVYATDESGIQATTTVSEVVLTRKKDDSSQETKTRSVWIEETDEPGKYVANFKVNETWTAGEYEVTYVGVMDKKGNIAYVSTYKDPSLLPLGIVSVLPKQDEPTSKQEEPTSKQEEPTSKQEEPTSKQEEPTSKQEEPTSKQEEPSSKQDEPSSKQDEPSSKQDEPSSKQDEPSSKQDEPSSKQDEPSSKQDEPSSTQNPTSSSSTRNTTRSTASTTQRITTTRYYSATRTLVNTVKQVTVRSNVDTSDPNHLPIWIGLGLIAAGAFALAFVWKEEV